jgi:hypothetical protein
MTAAWVVGTSLPPGTGGGRLQQAMCDLKGCDNEGSNVPQIVVVMRAGGHEFVIPSVTSLRICDVCKVLVLEPTDVLKDGGQRIVTALLKMRSNAKFVSKKLGWTNVDDPDFKRLAKARAS